MNIATWVERNGRRLADHTAVGDGERPHASWQAFAARTASLAAGMHDEFGLEPGDRVAVVMNNRPEYLEALFAIWHAGLVAVPVNARLHRDEIGYILDQSGTVLAVADEDHAADVESLVNADLRAAIVAPGERWRRLGDASPRRLVDRRPGRTRRRSPTSLATNSARRFGDTSELRA